jgi:predicted nucleotidyltransferase
MRRLVGSVWPDDFLRGTRSYPAIKRRRGALVDTRDHVVATLQAHEAELRASGIRGLALFGSTARGDDRPDSDVDLTVLLEPEAHIGLFRFVGLEQRLSDLLGRPVQLLAEPIEDVRLKANIGRDRRRVF